jgi:hypothetical protein
MRALRYDAGAGAYPASWVAGHGCACTACSMQRVCAKGSNVLDVANGTGDAAIAIAAEAMSSALMMVLTRFRHAHV